MFTSFRSPARLLLLSLLLLAACGQKGPLTAPPRPATQPVQAQEQQATAETQEETEEEGEIDE